VLARNASLDTAHSTGSIEITILETPAVPAAAKGGSMGTPGSKTSNKTKGGTMSMSDTAASTDLDTAVRYQDANKPAHVAAPTADGAVSGPELVGFVLLDPLCEAGEETGYVVSIQRMKSSAHAGESDHDGWTLKLRVCFHNYLQDTPACALGMQKILKHIGPIACLVTSLAYHACAAGTDQV
jgi:hypothetical protein